jgi:hypothetical protein
MLAESPLARSSAFSRRCANVTSSVYSLTPAGYWPTGESETMFDNARGSAAPASVEPFGSPVRSRQAPESFTPLGSLRLKHRSLSDMSQALSMASHMRQSSGLPSGRLGSASRKSSGLANDTPLRISSARYRSHSVDWQSLFMGSTQPGESGPATEMRLPVDDSGRALVVGSHDEGPLEPIYLGKDTHGDATLYQKQIQQHREMRHRHSCPNISVPPSILAAAMGAAAAGQQIGSQDTPADGTAPQAPPPCLRRNSLAGETIPRMERRVSFSRVVNVDDTHSSYGYDRRPVLMPLTKEAVKQIKQELYDYKTMEMRVHRDSIHNISIPKLN